ncbi:MAG: 8-oxo-dGTP diphosphatase MutT [Firmicutes bacterium]|nr:8-oxo-dGTP diphosphatase MutT [Bacillota bacterium]
MIKVTAAILTKDGKVLIARRPADDPLAGKWEFPGGKIEAGESPEECLRREMREEFKVDVSVGKFFGASKYRYEHAAIHLMAYLARWEKGEFDPVSHPEYRWVRIDELDRYDFAPADKPLVEKLRQNGIIE